MATNKSTQKPAQAVRAPAPAAQARESAPAPKEEAAAPSPEAPAKRTTVPKPPFVVGPTSQQVVATLRGCLNAAGPVGRDKGASARNALLAARSVPTRNLHPSVATYKAEVVEYLEGQVEQSDSLIARG